jgi:hypothetical protein
VIACSDSAAEKLRVLATLFDLDNDGWLSQSELTGFLVTLAHVLHAIGYFKTPISEEEAESTVLRCLHDVGVSKQQVREKCVRCLLVKKYSYRISVQCYNLGTHLPPTVCEIVTK